MLSKDFSASSLRKTFIEFFQKRGHQHLPSSSLLPSGDPTVLFTTAGMQQFKNWYLNPDQAQYSRVVTIQPSFRTSDIEEVGDESHLTLFEMLGHFSFGYPQKQGSYFKKEAIEWGFEFLTKVLGFSKERISATYFAGDEKTGADVESAEVLKTILPPEKIKGRNRKENFWGPTGSEGPCGPNIEFYIDEVEVWNAVFNEYYFKDGKYRLLKDKGVDEGAGFERILMKLENVKSVYETSLFKPIIEQVSQTTAVVRVIADHSRAIVFLISDGVSPSNKGQGYVLRRLMRRIIVKGQKLGLEKGWFEKVADAVENIYDQREYGTYQDEYRHLDIEKTKKVFVEEEEKFLKTLRQGEKILEKELARGKTIPGKTAFDLYQTYGFPLELTKELVEEREGHLDIEKYQKELEKHQEISRRGLEKKFKGGLAGHSEAEVKLHTATHLLHQSLRQVLGTHIKQMGSNITTERLRFDFSHPQKVTEAEIKKIENLVNEKIKEDLPVSSSETSLDEALKSGALAFFGERYGEKVKVYSIGDPSAGSGPPFSREVCGGPHVSHTGELGQFKIIKEESAGSGIRRIKAVVL